MKNTLFIGLATLLALVTSINNASAVTGPVGGGILHAGLDGTYYNDTDFKNEIFKRRDIRIDFDWGEVIKPGGGVPWDKIQSIGTDNYSIRWEGQIMSRFSENYTFTIEADSVRFWIKPAGTADWASKPLIDYWPASEPAKYAPQSANFAMEAGKPYDVRIEYRERTGPARMRLFWSSPSTPQEVIQPTAMNGSQPPDKSIVLADAVYGASNWKENYPWGEKGNPRKDDFLELDENNWPMEDFSFLIRPQDRTLNPGTYMLRFKGSARVRLNLAKAEFYSADGKQRFGEKSGETKPEDGYNPATNTTTLRMVILPNQGNCWMAFADTDRDGPQGTKYERNSGLTDVQLMRPISPGSDTPHDFDEFISREFLREFGNTFVCFRWNDVNGDSDAGKARTGQASGEWADRMPFGPNCADGRQFDRNNPKKWYSYTNENHEYKILLHNRLGRDLYIQVPHFATDDYIRKLAQLIRFGADEKGNPYDKPTANAYFPPLNPNLRVNLEYSNETPWNTAGQYPQGHWMRTEPDNLRKAWLKDPNSKDGKRFAILNYDGLFDPETDIRGFLAGKRFFALRTVEISNIFREVFGDENMPSPGKQDPRVRPLLMYQYDNANNTARDTLFFIDNYFNKTDPKSTYAGEPKPVNYFIYAGGAATYYASQDPIGLDNEHPLTKSGLGTFEEPKLPDGVAKIAPAGSPWKFEGTAGIWASAARQEGKLGEIPAPVKTIDDHLLRGFKFTVGPKDVAVYEVGRYVHDGNSGEQGIFIMDESGKILFNLALNLRDYKTGEMAWTRTGQVIFFMSGKSYNYPVILQAGKSYYLVCIEREGNNYSEETELVSPPGVTIDCAVAVKTEIKGWSHQFVSAREGKTANRTFGPLNFRVAEKPIATSDGSLELGFLQDSRDGVPNWSKSFEDKWISRQALFLAGNGSASLEITIPTPGIYALVYNLAQKPDQTPWIKKGWGENASNPLMIFVDDGSGERSITPDSQGCVRPYDKGWDHSGYWAKPEIGFDFFGSVPFETKKPNQKVKIRFAGTGKLRDNVGREIEGTSDTKKVVMLDNIRLASSAIMTAGPIPGGGGFAEGAPDVSNWEARIMSMYKYVQTFGVKAASYEGGWYPGGDANKMPLQFYSSFFDPKMIEGERNAVQAMARAGMVMNTDYSRDFAVPDFDIGNSGKYSRIKAWRSLNAELPKEATNGLPLLSTLTHESIFWSNLQEGAKLQPGGWMSWNVIVPKSAKYAFHVETTPGGRIDVRVDESQIIVQGNTGGILENKEGIFLTKGLHNIRARAFVGAFELKSISAAKSGQSFGTAGLSARNALESVELEWPSVPGVEGYNIYYKSRTAADWTRQNSKIIPAGANSMRVSGLPLDTTHDFVLTIVRGGAESAFSNQVTAVPMRAETLSAWNEANALREKERIGFMVDASRIVALDLRSAATMDFADRKAGDKQGGWTDQGPTNDYSMMPLGKVNLLGVPFEIINPAENNGRGAVVLRGGDLDWLPEQSQPIPVAKKVERFFFLHTAAWAKSAGSIGEYIVNYADGSSQSIPLAVGVNIADWWDSNPLENAKPAIVRENRGGFPVRIFVFEWRNPKPDIEVKSLFLNSKGVAVPILVAISAESIKN